MFKVVRKLDYTSVKDISLLKWLDKKFHANLVLNSSPQESDKNDYSLLQLQELLRYGQDFDKFFPKNDTDALFYIRAASYPIANLNGRACFNYIWPKFFSTFPAGQIWLIELSEKDWFLPIWDGGKIFATKNNISISRDGVFQPQEGTGFSSENLPMIALSFMQTCIFPYLNAVTTHSSSGLIFLYIPDRSFNYSFLKENITFSKMFFAIGLDSAYSDKKAFYDYGSKLEGQSNLINPIRLTSFFDWFIQTVENIMTFILAIEDPEQREIFTMTLNRAFWDAQTAVSNEIPYVSKNHFFELIDKLANLQIQIKNYSGTNIIKEEKAEWLKFVSFDFLKDILSNESCEKWGIMKEHLSEIINKTVEELVADNFSPEDLHNIRNSIHGYKIKDWKNMSKRTGSLTNNISLLATPLLLSMLSEISYIKTENKL